MDRYPKNKTDKPHPDPGLVFSRAFCFFFLMPFRSTTLVTRRYHKEVNAIGNMAGIFDDLWDVNFKGPSAVRLVLVRLLCRFERHSPSKVDRFSG